MTITNQKNFVLFALCFIAFILPGCNHSNPQDLMRPLKYYKLKGVKVIND